MLSGFWQFLRDTSPGQATFLGSVFGFLALLCGAWANASFNRRRDDRLRREEQRAVATALRAELAGCKRALLKNIEDLSRTGAAPTSVLVTPQLVHAVQIMPHMIPKLGLLDQETIEKVANAYVAIDEHGDQMLLFAGQPATGATGSRHLVSVSAGNKTQAIAIHNGVVGAIQEAIDRLDGTLRRLPEITVPAKR
jgi:hypothetical protein